jgi:hypothetical protein
MSVKSKLLPGATWCLPADFKPDALLAKPKLQFQPLELKPSPDGANKNTKVKPSNAQ